MISPSSPTSGTWRRTAALRLAGVAGSALAATAVWALADLAGGVPLHTPAFGASQPPASLPAGFAAAVAALVGLAGWAVLTLIERTTRRPRRIWAVTGLVLTLLSLSAPLSGHGISGADRVALAGMHLAVAAVLVPILAATTRPRRRNGSPSVYQPSQAAPPGHATTPTATHGENR
jgi:hypothetical protein